MVSDMDSSFFEINVPGKCFHILETSAILGWVWTLILFQDALAQAPTTGITATIQLLRCV